MWCTSREVGHETRESLELVDFEGSLRVLGEELAPCGWGTSQRPGPLQPEKRGPDALHTSVRSATLRATGDRRGTEGEFEVLGGAETPEPAARHVCWVRPAGPCLLPPLVSPPPVLLFLGHRLCDLGVLLICTPPFTVSKGLYRPIFPLDSAGRLRGRQHRAGLT